MRDTSHHGLALATGDEIAKDDRMPQVLMVTSRWLPEPAGWDAALIASHLDDQTDLTLAIVSDGWERPPDYLPASSHLYETHRHGSVSHVGQAGAARSLSDGALIARQTYTPVPDLIEFVDEAGRESDFVVFAGAAEAIANGMGVLRRKAILAPLGGVGDDSIARKTFSLARAAIHLSPGEAKAWEAHGPLRTTTLSSLDPHLPWSGQGTPVATVELVSLKERGSLVLAMGPPDPKYQFDELIANWCALMDRPYTRRRTLLITGADQELLPRRPDVATIPTGSLLELRRHLQAVDLVILPARAESGFVLMSEAWRSGAAVLGSADNEPIRLDLEASSGGRTYSNTEEFVLAVNELTEQKDAYAEAGRSWLDSLPQLDLNRVFEQAEGV